LIRSYYSRKLQIINKKDSDISPQFLTVLGTLVKGEVSAPFSLDGRFAMIKLINRKKASVKPLQLVSNSIRTKMIKNKYKENTEKYLLKLKGKSEISVNANIWKKIKKDLGESTNVN